MNYRIQIVSDSSDVQSNLQFIGHRTGPDIFNQLIQRHSGP